MARDPDAEVRAGVAMTLPLLTSGEQWRELDTREIREILTARLDDPDNDARCEALFGLAYRRDPRAFPRVQAALSRPDDDVWKLEMMAAGALADSRLHHQVLRHLEGWDDADTRIVDIVRRLTDPAGPGDDVLAGVASMCILQAEELPYSDALAQWRVMYEMLTLAPHRTGDFFEAVAARLVGHDKALGILRDLLF